MGVVWLGVAASLGEAGLGVEGVGQGMATEGCFVALCLIVGAGALE